jgi:hypothetical protein
MFTKGRKLAPTREMIEVFNYTSIKKMSQSSLAYKSLIEAIEGTFSSYKHSILVSEYQHVANQKDDEYAAVGTEPPYFKFEIAYFGHFAAEFIERSKRDKTLSLLEVDIISEADVNDIHTSLAFTSLLKLDVFVVDVDLNLLVTNAVEERRDNPCCIVIADEYGFRLRPFNNGLPLALSTDGLVSRYTRREFIHPHERILEVIGDGSDRGYLLTSNKSPSTSILDRIAHIEGIPSAIRLYSLANTLLNRRAASCTIAYLESCSIGGDYRRLITSVNEKMIELRETR